MSACLEFSRTVPPPPSTLSWGPLPGQCLAPLLHAQLLCGVLCFLSLMLWPNTFLNLEHWFPVPTLLPTPNLCLSTFRLFCKTLPSWGLQKSPFLLHFLICSLTTSHWVESGKNQIPVSLAMWTWTNTLNSLSLRILNVNQDYYNFKLGLWIRTGCILGVMKVPLMLSTTSRKLSKIRCLVTNIPWDLWAKLNTRSHLKPRIIQ